MYMDTRLCSSMLLLLAAAAAATAAAVILDPVDFLALQSIHRSLRDLPGSTFLRSWDFTGDPCNFPGVFCGGGRVVGLSLGDPRAGAAGLSGHLDDSIGHLSALSELSLVPGAVSGQLPPSLSRCTSLRFLALSHNFFSGAIPAGLSSLRYLRTLDLSNNNLYGAIPLRIFTIPSVTNILLSHNRLTGRVPAFATPKLVRLDLKRNLLSGELPPSLPQSLRYLSLSNNLLTGRVDRLICRLNELNYLDLSVNRFSGPVPSCVFEFPLTSLQLQRNAFAGPVRAAGKAEIELVDLSHNRFSGEIAAALAWAHRVYLNDNRFDGEVPAEFAAGLVAGRIDLLYLQHNYVTEVAGLRPGTMVPPGAELCLHFNCMTVPVNVPCPLRRGRRRTRPPEQCRRRPWQPGKS